MNRYVSLMLFLVLVLGGGLVLGGVTVPGGWYAGLTKPSFNPPAWLFGPVWTVLYLLIAVAGWRAWQGDRTGWPMKLWWAQLALNFLWTPVFFGAHRTGLALVVIVLMLAAILGFIATAWRLDRAAAWLFVPYAAWVAFASVLNSSIWMLRRNMSRTRLLLEALLAAALTPEARDTFVGASANAQPVPTFAGDAARAAE